MATNACTCRRGTPFRQHGAGAHGWRPPRRLLRRSATATAYWSYVTYTLPMSESARDLPVTDVRDRLADVINEAAYGGQVTYLTRHGRRLAAIVPVETADAAERWEDEQLGRMADEAVEEMARTGEKPVSLDEVRRELGV